MIFSFLIFIFYSLHSFSQECFPLLSAKQMSEFSQLQAESRSKKISSKQFRESHPLFKQTLKLSEEELLTRAVFAEGVSTHFRANTDCKDQSLLIFKAITWGIKNRIEQAEISPHKRQRFGRDLRGVLFHPDQFNPSVSPKVEYSRLFACPTDYYNKSYFSKLTCHKGRDYNTQVDFQRYWQQAKDAVQEVWASTTKDPLNGATSFYYPLYVYSNSQACQQYRQPAWANKDKAIKNIKIGDQSLNSKCIWFFK